MADYWTPPPLSALFGSGAPPLPATYGDGLPAPAVGPSPTLHGFAGDTDPKGGGQEIDPYTGKPVGKEASDRNELGLPPTLSDEEKAKLNPGLFAAEQAKKAASNATPITPGAVNVGTPNTGGIGAQLGGQFGLANSIAQQYENQAQQMGAKPVDQGLSRPDWQAQSGSMQQQQIGLNMLGNQAAGNAWTAADQQHQAGVQQAALGQQSLAASAGGGQAGAYAQRQAQMANAMGAIQGQNSLDALRAQEQAAARGQYSQATGALRGSDQSAQQQGQSFELGQAGLQDQGKLASQGMANQTLGAQLGATSSGYQALQQANYAQMSAIQKQAQLQNAAEVGAGAGFVGGVFTMGMGAGAASDDAKSDSAGGDPNSIPSDIRVKQDVRGEGGKPSLRQVMAGPSSAGQHRQREAAEAPPESYAGSTVGPITVSPGGSYDGSTVGPVTVAPGYQGSTIGPVSIVPNYGGSTVGPVSVAPAPNYAGSTVGPVAVAPSPPPLAQVMSDEHLKLAKSGHPEPMDFGKTDVDQFLETLHPYSYKYTDKSYEPTSSPSGGRYLGVMAQNVERGPTGDTIVTNTPRGKALEGGALMSAMAAGEGRLHQRLSALEERMGKR